MDTEFKFNTKQINTLRVSGLAAYVQRPPKDRVGWVYAAPVLLKGWKPERTAYSLQHIEVTFESLQDIENEEGKNWDFDEADYLMLTAHTSYFTDSEKEIERFFSHYTDKAEFTHHPDKVDLPKCCQFHPPKHGFKISDSTPGNVKYMLKKQKLLQALLKAQAADQRVIVEKEEWKVSGKLKNISLFGFQVERTGETAQLWFMNMHDMKIWVDDEGYPSQIWPLRPNKEAQPQAVWSCTQQKWIFLDDPKNN